VPLQSRVDPFGELIATPARGLFMGNRGGRFHRDDRTLSKRRWASRQWICCVLRFKGRHHDVWGRGYTALFFLDEVTALAAGHRPCFECRRADALAFANAWAKATRSVVPHATEMDLVLAPERLEGRGKRCHQRPIDDLPDGACVTLKSAPHIAYAIRGSLLLRWSATGYLEKVSRPSRAMVDVLTPPSILGALAAGFPPQWHPSAEL
jgi:hypothetical protein